jgi:hypothetical protein
VTLKTTMFLKRVNDISDDRGSMFL